MNPVMFKTVEDGAEEPVETRVPVWNGGNAAALELAALRSLGGFDGIFDWAKSAARQVGATTTQVPPGLVPTTKVRGVAARPWENLRVNAAPVIGRGRPAPTVADRVGAALDQTNRTAIAARSPKALMRMASADPVGEEATDSEMESVAQWLSGLAGLNASGLAGFYEVPAPDAAYRALEQTARAKGLGSLGDLYALAARGRVDEALNGPLGSWLSKIARKVSSTVKTVVRAPVKVVRATGRVMGRAAGNVLKTVKKVGTAAARGTVKTVQAAGRGAQFVGKGALTVGKVAIAPVALVGKTALNVAKQTALLPLTVAAGAVGVGMSLLQRRQQQQQDAGEQVVYEDAQPQATTTEAQVEPAPPPQEQVMAQPAPPVPTAPPSSYVTPTYTPRDPYAQPAPPDWRPSYTTAAETTEADYGPPPEYAEPAPEGPAPDAYAEPDAVTAPEYAEPPPAEGYDQSYDTSSSYVQGLGYLLGETDPVRIRAKERNMARKDAGYLDPRALLSQSGAAEIGVTAAKAATASRLHQSRAKLIENRVKRISEEGKREKDPNRKNQLAAEALDWSRRLFMEHAEASRSATVAGGLQVALEHRKAADSALTEAGAKEELGKAASALVQTQVFAKTPVRVELPEILSQGYIEKLRTGVALSGLGEQVARVMTGRQQMPVGPSDLTQSAEALVKIGGRTRAPWPRAGSAIPPQIRPGGRYSGPKPAHPTFKSGIPGLNMPKALFASQFTVDEEKPGFPGSLYTLAGLGVARVPQTFDGLGGLDGVFDFLGSIADVAKSVVAPHTVVGKFLNGDTQGATADAIKFGAGVMSRGPGAPAPVPANPQERAVLNQISERSASILSTTGGKIGLVAVVGGIGILGVVLLARRRSA